MTLSQWLDRDADRSREWLRIGRVASIKIYPVKGLGGYEVQSAALHRWGLEGDRRWCVVDEDGIFLSQRRHPRMAAISASIVPGGLALFCSQLGSMLVRTPTRDVPMTAVRVWDDVVQARGACENSSAWMSAALSTPCRLMYMAYPNRDRAIAAPYASEGDVVSFADGFPLLATATASLDALREWLSAPTFSMDRFRANLVVDTAQPWIEDRWSIISCGEVVFEAPKPCARCVAIKVDQVTGEMPDLVDPLRALAQRHPDQRGRPIFGQNLIPRRLGTIHVGDQVATAVA